MRRCRKPAVKGGNGRWLAGSALFKDKKTGKISIEKIGDNYTFEVRVEDGGTTYKPVGRKADDAGNKFLEIANKAAGRTSAEKVGLVVTDPDSPEAKRTKLEHAFDIHCYLNCVAHFAQWAHRHRLALDKMDEKATARFLAEHLPHCDCPYLVKRGKGDARAALSHLLRTLSACGVTRRNRADSDPLEAELASFDHYMAEVNGLARSTRQQRVHILLRFLSERFASRIENVHIVSARHQSGLVRAKCYSRRNRLWPHWLRSRLRVPHSGATCRPRWRESNSLRTTR